MVDPLEQIRQMIEEKQYSHARVLLDVMDHPRKTEWLAKLEVLEAASRDPTTNVGDLMEALHASHMPVEAEQAHTEWPDRSDGVARMRSSQAPAAAEASRDNRPYRLQSIPLALAFFAPAGVWLLATNWDRMKRPRRVIPTLAIGWLGSPIVFALLSFLAAKALPPSAREDGFQTFSPEASSLSGSIVLAYIGAGVLVLSGLALWQWKPYKKWLLETGARPIWPRVPGCLALLGLTMGVNGLVMNPVSSASLALLHRIESLGPPVTHTDGNLTFTYPAGWDLITGDFDPACASSNFLTCIARVGTSQVGVSFSRINGSGLLHLSTADLENLVWQGISQDNPGIIGQPPESGPLAGCESVRRKARLPDGMRGQLVVIRTSLIDVILIETTVTNDLASAEADVLIESVLSSIQIDSAFCAGSSATPAASGDA